MLLSIIAHSSSWRGWFSPTPLAVSLATADKVVFGYFAVQGHARPVELRRRLAFIPLRGAEGV
jgi:hypothetical protein